MINKNLLPFIIHGLILVFFSSCSKKEKAFQKTEKTAQIIKKYKMPDLTEKIKEAKSFVEKNNMNQDFCILIDLGIHSGRKRFFVWNFKENKIINSFLVGHGCGDSPWSADLSRDQASFSNEIDSHRSSLGKYEIGNRGYSNWGVNINYIMKGLEETNSNAQERIIVFHSWEVVSDEEIYPKGTPEGWGCPTISNKSFLTIDPLIKSSKKPVLMWIYSSKIN